MMVKACEVCGKQYKAWGKHASRSRWCSRACRAVFDGTRTGENSPRWRGGPRASYSRYREKRPAEPKRKAAGYNRICPTCGLNGVKKGHVFHDGCNPKRPMVMVACVDCGRVRRVWSARIPERCRSCALKNRTGPNNSNWKGGIRSENSAARASSEYAQWRTAVFGRDKYTCQMCFQVGYSLHAHHIMSFSEFPDLRFNVDNGVTLCEECHKSTGSYLSRRKADHGQQSLFPEAAP